jgi:hypothetical protein
VEEGGEENTTRDEDLGINKCFEFASPSNKVRCSFSNRILHSRMPLVPTPLLRLKLLRACGR